MKNENIPLKCNSILSNVLFVITYQLNNKLKEYNQKFPVSLERDGLKEIFDYISSIPEMVVQEVVEYERGTDKETLIEDIEKLKNEIKELKRNRKNQEVEKLKKQLVASACKLKKLQEQIEYDDRARNWELVEFLKKEVNYLSEIRGLQKELLDS